MSRRPATTQPCMASLKHLYRRRWTCLGDSWKALASHYAPELPRQLKSYLQVLTPLRLCQRYERTKIWHMFIRSHYYRMTDLSELETAIKSPCNDTEEIMVFDGREQRHSLVHLRPRRYQGAKLRQHSGLDLGTVLEVCLHEGRWWYRMSLGKEFLGNSDQRATGGYNVSVVKWKTRVPNKGSAHVVVVFKPCEVLLIVRHEACAAQGSSLKVCVCAQTTSMGRKNGER